MLSSLDSVILLSGSLSVLSPRYLKSIVSTCYQRLSLPSAVAIPSAISTVPLAYNTLTHRLILNSVMEFTALASTDQLNLMVWVRISVETGITFSGTTASVGNIKYIAIIVRQVGAVWRRTGLFSIELRVGRTRRVAHLVVCNNSHDIGCRWKQFSDVEG